MEESRRWYLTSMGSGSRSSWRMSVLWQWQSRLEKGTMRIQKDMQLAKKNAYKQPRTKGRILYACKEHGPGSRVNVASGAPPPRGPEAIYTHINERGFPDPKQNSKQILADSRTLHPSPAPGYLQYPSRSCQYIRWPPTNE